MLHAHQTGLSYLKLTKEQSGEISVLYKKPLEDSQAKGITINFPASCSRSETDSVTVKNGFIVEKFTLLCSGEGLKNARIWIDGLVSSDKGLLFTYKHGDKIENALLRSSRPFVLIEDKRSSAEIFGEYVELGFFHILSGYDHLLFLFALLLLVPNYKILFFSITAFTLSHSVSLGLSALHLVSVPAPFVEAMIALSIVILYREVIADDRESFSRRHLPWMVLFFGLLHGLGFASALTEIGLPKNFIPASLLAFNIGVELGQLLFVVTILLIAWIAKRIFGSLFISNRRVIFYYLSYIFGSLSTLWLIERVGGF